MDYEITEVEFPAGCYFLGDPSHVIDEPEWGLWLENSEYAATRDCSGVMGFRYLWAAFKTGCGCFRGSDNFSYSVVSGMLGVVPEKHVRTDPCDYKKLGRLYRFHSNFRIRQTNDRNISCGGILIDINAGVVKPDDVQPDVVMRPDEFMLDEYEAEFMELEKTEIKTAFSNNVIPFRCTGDERKN